MRALRVAAGAVLVAVPGAVALTRWGVLIANDPVYPLTLLVTAVLGAALVVTGLRSRTAARPGLLRRVLRVAGLLAAIGLAAGLWWARPFPATERALAALQSDSDVAVVDTRASTTFTPADATGTGLVLYPGARVDPRAYAVLAHRIAAAGHPVVVLKCPFDIELLCVGKAAGVIEGGGAWAVGGHSLGGVAASTFAADSASGAAGLALWASYPVTDLAGRTTLPVASVSGSQDGLSTPAKVAAARPLLPPTTVSTEIEGAVHSFFGDYGDQPGDGTPTIGREAAQDQIVAATLALLERAVAPVG